MYNIVLSLKTVHDTVSCSATLYSKNITSSIGVSDHTLD